MGKREQRLQMQRTARAKTATSDTKLYTRAQLDAEVTKHTEALKREVNERVEAYLQEFDKTHVPVEIVNLVGRTSIAQVAAYEIVAMATAYATILGDNPERLKGILERYGNELEKRIDKIAEAYGNGTEWRESSHEVRVDLDAVLDCLKAGDGAALLALERTKDPIAADIATLLAESAERERSDKYTSPDKKQTSDIKDRAKQALLSDAGKDRPSHLRNRQWSDLQKHYVSKYLVAYQAKINGQSNTMTDDDYEVYKWIEGASATALSRLMRDIAEHDPQ